MDETLDQHRLSGPQPEVMLAQEQGVTMREAGTEKELQAEFGIGVKEGTLVLTNRRLIFACTNERDENLPGEAGLNPFGKIDLVYTEVEDLDSIPSEAPNMFVPLSSISKVTGHKGDLGRPSLEVAWVDANGKHSCIFTETLTGRKARALNDWASAIDNLKAGKQKLVSVPPAPSTDTLEGKIIHVLSDMQEKGVFSIEEAVETEYNLKLDPDDVQAACDRLAEEGLLVRNSELTGDAFYRRVSPLG